MPRPEHTPTTITPDTYAREPHSGRTRPKPTLEQLDSEDTAGRHTVDQWEDACELYY